jgi:uncharacterized FAD-dependent dehydrogenase
MPQNICLALEAALYEFDKKMPGFIEKGLLIAPETRTSSPLRIVRKKNGESVSVGGIYPVGEGAGYAGGILTSAADGARLAILESGIPFSDFYICFPNDETFLQARFKR